MTSHDSLPVVLVIAKTKTAACKIIAELVEDDKVGTAGEDYVWHIENKYYEADVRFHAIGDDDRVGVCEADIDGLLIHLADDEGVEEISRREARCGRAGVRLAARGEVSGALAAWAAPRRLEVVALSGAAPDAGAGRLRDALQAHVWRGLRMRTDGAPPMFYEHSDESSSGGEEDEEEEEAAAVERAERFASVLAALPAAAGHAAALHADERRRAAELLVAAFARALGHPLE